jgi:aflatoxin B1 aldehyde reductase
MSKEKGDKVIIRASSATQLEQNLVDLEKGPLPDEVLEAVEKGWLRVKGVVPQYYH